MKIQLKLEELAQFLVCLYILIDNEVPWWVYPILVLGPDIGMLGYLISPRVGAISYNLCHHKGVGILVAVIGLYIMAATFMQFIMGMEPAPTGYLMFIAGVILYGHASMDRIFGYGLKYSDSFQHTHLGMIGKPFQPQAGIQS